MINNEFILKVNSKDLTQKSSKVPNDKTAIDNSFKKILNEKSKNDNKINNSLDNKKITNSNEVEVIEDSNFKKAIKEVVELISNEENFQGNKLEDGVIEEVVTLLNQILNSSEFENLLPVKLEDPMLMSNSHKLINTINNEEENSLLNSIYIQPGSEIKNNDINKEAFNLANTILETLNSENINEAIPSGKVNELKAALELLSENVLSNVSILPEVVGEQKLGVKDLKTIKTNSEMDKSNVDSVDKLTGDSSEDSIEGEIKSILTELKSNLSGERNTKTNEEMTKYRVTPEATEEDKVLAKILGESGSLSKQSAFMSRLNVNSSDVIKEPMVISKETMGADIIKNVKFMMKNEVAELKVKIYPKELGEMTIKLLSEEGILKADIKATSKETYNLLHSNLSEIKKSLEQQNIKIYEVNIGLYSEDTTYYSGEQANNERFENNENRQGRNSSRESGFLIDDLENDESLYDDSSVNLLV